MKNDRAFLLHIRNVLREVRELVHRGNRLRGLPGEPDGRWQVEWAGMYS